MKVLVSSIIIKDVWHLQNLFHHGNIKKESINQKLSMLPLHMDFSRKALSWDFTAFKMYGQFLFQREFINIYKYTFFFEYLKHVSGFFCNIEYWNPGVFVGGKFLCFWYHSFKFQKLLCDCRNKINMRKNFPNQIQMNHS